MNFKIGDRVAVIDDVLKGRVVSIEQEKIVVLTDDGMNCSFFSAELVKISSDQSRFMNSVNVSNCFLKQKQDLQVKKKEVFKKQRNEVVMEVDLHIEKLVKSIKGLDSYDMLNLQIDTAKRKIEYCISKRISKIVFIHGIGEGVLKNELHYLLDKYPVKYYDASYQKYGRGATEVYIYQNN